MPVDPISRASPVATLKSSSRRAGSSRDSTPRRQTPRAAPASKPNYKKSGTHGLLRQATANSSATVKTLAVRKKKDNAHKKEEEDHKKRTRSVEIEIPIYRHKRYRSERIPPSQPITLAPVKDSTAYIVDKIVLPIALVDPKAQRNLYYIVGWHDLRAARITVLATEILDWVDPWEFEDWNYRDFLKKEEEKERAKEEAEELKRAAGNTPGRKGRPRKVPLAPLAPELSVEDQELVVPPSAGPSLSTPQKRPLRELLEEETDAEENAAEEVGAEEDLDMDLDAEEQEEDEAIRRQLFPMELEYEEEEPVAKDSTRSASMDELAMPVPRTIQPQGFVDDASSSEEDIPERKHPTLASREGSTINSLEKIFGKHSATAVSASARQHHPANAAYMQRASNSPVRTVPEKQYRRSSTREAVPGKQYQRSPPANGVRAPPGISSTSPAGQPIASKKAESKRPYEEPSSSPRKRAKPSGEEVSSAVSHKSHATTTSAKVHPMFAKTVPTHQTTNGASHHGPSASSSQNKMHPMYKETPVPLPSYAQASQTTTQASKTTTQASKTTTQASKTTQSSLQSFGFTPVAASVKNLTPASKSKPVFVARTVLTSTGLPSTALISTALSSTEFGNRPAKSFDPSEDVLGDAAVTPLKSSKGKGKEKEKQKEKKPRKKKQVKVVDADAEAEVADDGWAVKKLLSDKYDYDEAGMLTHYFQVLWEGDWPPSQNPSWEPEANIGPELVNEYLAKKAKKDAKKGANGTPGSASKLPAHMPKKRYTNVSEAFEDGLIEDPQPRANVQEDDDDLLFGIQDLDTDKSKSDGTPYGAQLTAYQRLYG